MSKRMAGVLLGLMVACNSEVPSSPTGDAGAGEDRGFGGNFLGVAAMGTAAMAGIFALGVFTHDHPVDIPG